MKSRYPGDCHVCGLPWAAGASISKWVGKWVHDGCKEAERAVLAAGAVQLEIPMIEPEDSPRVVSKRRSNTHYWAKIG